MVGIRVRQYPEAPTKTDTRYDASYLGLGFRLGSGSGLGFGLGLGLGIRDKG